MDEVVDTFAVRDNVEWVRTNGTTGEVIRGTSHNLVTQVGIQQMVERGIGINSGAVAVGMKLGLGTVTPSATGAGAVLGTYLTGSNLIHDSGWPKSTLPALARRAQYQCFWGAGVATTASLITEAVLFNDANADVTSPAGNTIARVLITGGIKGAFDTLMVIWNLEFTPGA